MKWIVGTGRCGLHNYTKLYGGVIASPKDWKTLIVKRYHGEDWNEDYVREEIRIRRDMDIPFFTDCGQFMFIDIIAEEDPNSEFVWIIRRKEDCVASFMRRPGEENRIHPKGWNFDRDRKKELIEWYYDEVNKIIEEKLKGKKYVQIDTYSMEKVV